MPLGMSNYGYDLLGLHLECHYVYVQCISNTARHMIHQHQFNDIKYMDDILGIDVPSKIDASFDILLHLLHVLGSDISLIKLEKPSTRLNCLGILVDTESFTLHTSSENATKT